MTGMEFLGVKIDEVDLAGALEKARGFLRSGGQYKIFTPNPEMLVKARKDSYFRGVLNAGDLNLCDGFGLWLALKCSSGCHSSPPPPTGAEGGEESLNTNPRDPSREFTLSKANVLRMTKKAERIPGIDFMLELCALAEKENKSIYLLGSSSDEVVKQCAEALNKKFVHLKIAGFDRGPMIEENGMLAAGDNSAIDKINVANPEILFVAFGMGKQEKWIYENLAKMPSVKIAMGVGGAFDYISGLVNRAPCWMRQIGLEWAYRLIKEPKRIGRIFNATIRFTFLAIRENF